MHISWEIFIFSLHEMKQMPYSLKMNFLFIIYNYKRGWYFAQNDVIHVRTLCHINDDVALCAMTAKTETIGAGVEKVKIFSKSWKCYNQNCPCDLTKKMNTHMLYFCPLIRKLQMIEILKWAQRIQCRKQRSSNFTREIQLIFSQLWNATFLYFHGCEIQLFIFSRLWNTAFSKYALYLINISCISLLCI